MTFWRILRFPGRRSNRAQRTTFDFLNQLSSSPNVRKFAIEFPRSPFKVECCLSFGFLKFLFEIMNALFLSSNQFEMRCLFESQQCVARKHFIAGSNV